MDEYVVIKKDVNSILYKIVKEEDEQVTLYGKYYRTIKVVNKNEIRKASNEEIEKEAKRNQLLYNQYYNYYNKNNIIQRKERNKRSILGTILHIDGDQEYLDRCMELYKEVGIHAYGVSINEEEMPFRIHKVLSQIIPDIIVITGHDSYNGKGKSDLNNYTNTKNFIKTILEIKKQGCNAHIVAGACQSNFEALILNGASFASSPKRINVHTFDPAVIAIQISITSFLEKVDMNKIIKFDYRHGDIKC